MRMVKKPFRGPNVAMRTSINVPEDSLNARMRSGSVQRQNAPVYNNACVVTSLIWRLNRVFARIPASLLVVRRGGAPSACGDESEFLFLLGLGRMCEDVSGNDILSRTTVTCHNIDTMYTMIPIKETNNKEVTTMIMNSAFVDRGSEHSP
jgi:hypothetical protein